MVSAATAPRNSSVLHAGEDAVQTLLVPPWLLTALLAALLALAVALYVTAVHFARRRAHCTAHRGERAAWRHHVTLLLHVAALDCTSALLAAPLELASLAARGAWWPLPRHVGLCRTALALDSFLGASTNYGLAALSLHATSTAPLQILQSHSTFPPRPLRCLRMPASLPLIWTMAGLLSAPLLVYGQLVAEPGGGVMCAVMLPARRAAWDRLLMALLRSVFSLGVPLVLLVTGGLRAAMRLCSGAEHKRLNVLALVWTISFVLLSLHRSVFAAIYAVSQAFSDHPTHLVPPFISITSPAATLVFSALHFSTCVLRPALYCASFCSTKS